MRRQLFHLLLSTCALFACDVDDLGGPSPEGSIVGTVIIDGAPAGGVVVTLSSGQTTTTAADGSYSFPKVAVEAYGVTVSGFPPDVQFDATTKVAIVATPSEEVEVDFTGMRIRASRVEGTITVDGEPAAGITVSLDGHDRTTTTDAAGEYTFGDLLAGTYTVVISNFPSDVVFDASSQQVSVEYQEVAVADFAGHRVAE